MTRLLDLSESALAALCVAAFAVMFALGVATVVFRFILESSLAFPDEMIRYLFVWMVFLGSAVTLRRGAHAAISVFVKLMPAPLRRVVLLMAALISAAFFAALVGYGAELTIRVAPQISPALEVSMAWAYAAVPTGAAFLLIYMLEIIARLIVSPEMEFDADEPE